MWLLLNKTACLHSLYVERLVMSSQLRHRIDASAPSHTYGFIYIGTNRSSCHSNRINIKLSNDKISSVVESADKKKAKLCFGLIAFWSPTDLMKYELCFPFSQHPLFSSSSREVSQGATD